MSRAWVYTREENSWKGKLTGLLIALLTAILAVLIVYPFTGGVSDGGLTGAVAGISAADLLSKTLKRLKKHAFKLYIGLVFLNTFASAFAVLRFGLHPENTAEFMVMFLAVYTPLALLDYGVIKIVEKRYRTKTP
ncbi:hypothetical protein [Thermococcus pacificus]|uniref:Uncharacterized protein n=1 Tax=Thermococcus pacificus TaxID=71998 RepID=A0A218P9F8_9EURY|nr:hypothetical protein [Thermococcus pacificus]ASJ07424.1 hypothetical protein A3L08_08875 [Thermococcus pacificus]